MDAVNSWLVVAVPGNRNSCQVELAVSAGSHSCYMNGRLIYIVSACADQDKIFLLPFLLDALSPMPSHDITDYAAPLVAQPLAKHGDTTRSLISAGDYRQSIRRFQCLRALKLDRAKCQTRVDHCHGDGTGGRQTPYPSSHLGGCRHRFFPAHML